MGNKKTYVVYQGKDGYIIASSKECFMRYLKEDRFYQQMTSIQMVFDALHITMHQVFGWGAERNKKLKDSLQEMFLYICKRISKEAHEDEEMKVNGQREVFNALRCAEAEEEVETALKAACGQYYEDHNKRYTF